jgi:prolipoprotein diacylglyceryltransferase
MNMIDMLDALTPSLGIHDIWVALGLLVGLTVFAFSALRTRTWDDRLMYVITGIMVGGVIGARAAAFIEGWIASGPALAAAMWSFGGRSILGGLSGAYVGAIIAKKWIGYPHRTGDLFAPAVALGLAVGRIGCWLTEPPGTPTSLPWGIELTQQRIEDLGFCPGCVAGTTVHPSMLYEIFALLILFGAVLFLKGRLVGQGETFVFFLAAYAAARFLIEFSRPADSYIMGLSQSQLFLLAVSPMIAWSVRSQIVRGVYSQLGRQTSLRSAS